MTRKIWIGFAAVFVTTQILDGIVNFFILDPVYKSVSLLWRPEGEMKLWIFPVIGLFFSYFFTLIFSKGYENKGLAEGARYGLYVGLMMTVPYAYGNYAVLPIPYLLAVQWFIYGTIEYIIAGMVLAMIFRSKEPAASST